MKQIVLMALLALPVFGGNWVTLFDGKSLKGWTKQGNANWAAKDGTITVDSGPACLLTTNRKFENYELELEFKAAAGTNSGVFLNSEAKVKDPATDCYEINIAPPDNPFPTGSIVKLVKVESEKEITEWQTYKLRVDRGTVTIILNGREVVKQKMAKPRPAGFVGLQKNKGKVAFRKVRIRMLD